MTAEHRPNPVALDFRGDRPSQKRHRHHNTVLFMSFNKKSLDTSEWPILNRNPLTHLQKWPRLNFRTRSQDALNGAHLFVIDRSRDLTYTDEVENAGRHQER